jgi:hypothetical protein
MKTWTSILAAGAILAFAAPLGNAALRAIPDNADAVVRSSHSMASTTGKQLKNVKHVTKAKHAAISVGNGVYGPYAYVPADSLPTVAKAFTPPATRIGP